METGATPVLLSCIGRRAENPQQAVVVFFAEQFPRANDVAPAGALKCGGDIRLRLGFDELRKITRLARLNRGGDVPVDCAEVQSAIACDLRRGVDCAKTAERFARGVA